MMTHEGIILQAQRALPRLRDVNADAALGEVERQSARAARQVDSIFFITVKLST